MIKKSIHEINKKIEDGSVNVVTAEEMVTIVEELDAEGELNGIRIREIHMEEDPGQSVVYYLGDYVLGGGTIQ